MSRNIRPSNPAAGDRQQRRSRLGNLIREYRMRSNMTQVDFGSMLANTAAGDLPIPQTTISRWESGKVELDLDQIFAIENVLRLRPGKLSQMAGYAMPEVRASVEQAIRSDKMLNPALRQLLLESYRTFLRQGNSAA